MTPHSWEPAPLVDRGPRSRGKSTLRAEKRKKILTAATKVFARKGFPAARISDIARDAGVADGTVYLYFQGKDDLLTSIFQETMEQFLLAGRKIVAEVDDPAARIRTLVDLHLSILGADRDLAAVFQIELRSGRKAMSLLSQDKLVEYFDLLASSVEEGQSRELFRTDVRPKMVARILWGAVDEVVTHWVLAEKPSDLTLAGSTALSIILRGLGGGEAKP